MIFKICRFTLWNIRSVGRILPTLFALHDGIHDEEFERLLCTAPQDG